MRSVALLGVGVASIACVLALAAPSRADDEPNVGTERAAEQIFQPLTRILPLFSFSGERVIDLTLADPSKPLPKDLNLHVGALRIKETKVELQDPKIKLELLSAEAGILPVKVDITDLNEAGSFELPIQVYEPNLPVQRFVIDLSARDDVWAPLITILIGVFLSYGLHRLTDSYAPRQDLIARIEDVRAKAKRLVEISPDPSRRRQLRGIDERLAEIEVESSAAADLKRLDSEVGAIDEEIATIRREWLERAQVLGDKIKAAREDLLKEKNSFNPRPDPDETAALDEIDRGLLDAEETLSAEKLAAAEEKFEHSDIDFRDARVARQRRHLFILQSMTDDPEFPAPAEARGLEADAASKLDAGDPVGAAETLRRLSDLINTRRPIPHEALQEAAGTGQAPYGATAVAETFVPKLTSVRARDARRRAGRARLTWTVVSLAIAALSGLVTLYFGKPFGAGTDYLLAFFWGFGTDSTVQNAESLLGKLKGPAA